jgi:hypothetical protein
MKEIDNLDALFPLTELQKELFMTLNDQCKQLPLPTKFLSPKENSISESPSSSLKTLNELPSTPLETTQQFYSWFNSLQQERSSYNDLKYKDELVTLTGFEQLYQSILEKTCKELQVLDFLRKTNQFVYEKTHGLQRACEKLLEDQAST